MGDMIGRAIAAYMLFMVAVTAVVSICLWELIPWVWHHIHWS